MEFDVARGTSWTQQAHSNTGRKTRLLHCMQQCIPYSHRYFQGFHHVASVVLSTMEAAKDESHEQGECDEKEEDQQTMATSQLCWQFTTEHNNMTTDCDHLIEEKKDDDSIYSSDESILFRELHESPPLLISEQSSHHESSHKSSSKRSLAAPPTIQRHFDLATTSAIESSMEILHRLSLSHFADSMSGDDLLPLQTVLRLTILPFLAYFDASLHEMLWNSGFTGEDACSYSFCLPWILTWFSHDPFLMEQKQGGATVKRLFDAFVSGHPLLPVYVTVAVILANGKSITQELHDDSDFCGIHARFAVLPRQVNDWDDILDRAIVLMRRVPPKNIVPLAERFYSATSVHACLGYRTPQMLQQPVVLESSTRLCVPWRTTSQSVRDAAGLGEGDAALRKSRRRRRVAASALLVFFTASAISRYGLTSRPTNADSKLEPIQYQDQFLPTTDGLDAFEGFPVDFTVAEIENKPTNPIATLSPKVIVTTFLALYLRNFLFVSSGSVEGLEAQLLLRSSNDDPHPPLFDVATDLEH